MFSQGATIMQSFLTKPTPNLLGPMQPTVTPMVPVAHTNTHPSEPPSQLATASSAADKIFNGYLSDISEDEWLPEDDDTE
jgi:hypothetical protein